MRHVAIKIPYEAEPLMLASEMLAEMAVGLAADVISNKPTGVAPDGTITTGTVREAKPRTDDTSPDLPDEMPNPAEVFQGAAAPPPPAGLNIPDAAAPPPPPATTEAAPDVDVDAVGLPWDSRIHAGSKKQLKDGTWKRRRGIDTETLNAVEAELTELMAVPAATTAPPATTAAPPPPPPPPPAANAPPAFPDLMLRITRDAVAPERVAEVLAVHGVGSLPLLGKRSDLVPQVYADLFPVAG